MVDIHAHILPEIDDGSQSLEQSLKMAKMAVLGGTDSLIVTPHCNILGEYENYYDSELINKFNLLKDAISKNNIPLKLYLGMEVLADDNVLMLIKQNKIITLNNNKSNYILIEFPFFSNPMWATSILAAVSNAGITPIIAHPERYDFVQKYPPMIFDWVTSGALMQVNKGSLIGRYGPKAEQTSNLLLEHCLVHFVASDCHSHMLRTPYLNDAFSFVCENYSGDYAELLFNTNPTNIINGKGMIIPKPVSF